MAGSQFVAELRCLSGLLDRSIRLGGLPLLALAVEARPQVQVGLLALALAPALVRPLVLVRSWDH